MADEAYPLHPNEETPALWKVVFAFACVYIIWGSTYLAIRVTVETLPPLLSAGVRFLVAGGVMFTFLHRKGARPAPGQWKSATITGALMLLGGNGCVVWAETMIDSGVAALLVATVPMWMVFLNWVRPRGTRPGWSDVAGLAVGVLGVWILIDPRSPTGVHPVGAALVLFASFSWAIGSLYSRHHEVPGRPFLGVSMKMIGGGVCLLLGGLVTGELGRMDPASFSLRSGLALSYLIVFGSLVAFTAYIWLLRVSTPAKVGTYAFVNPAVAVVLGWAILGERLTPHMLAAMGLIVVAVMLIVGVGSRRAPVASKPPRMRRARASLRRRSDSAAGSIADDGAGSLGDRPGCAGEAVAPCEEEHPLTDRR